MILSLQARPHIAKTLRLMWRGGNATSVYPELSENEERFNIVYYQNYYEIY